MCKCVTGETIKWSVLWFASTCDACLADFTVFGLIRLHRASTQIQTEEYFPSQRRGKQTLHRKTLCRCCPNSAQMHTAHSEIDRYADRRADEWTDSQIKKSHVHTNMIINQQIHTYMSMSFLSFLSHLFLLESSEWAPCLSHATAWSRVDFVCDSHQHVLFGVLIE